MLLKMVEHYLIVDLIGLKNRLRNSFRIRMINLVNNKKGTILLRRFIAEFVVVGLVFGALRTSVSQVSDDIGIVNFLLSLDGKLFSVLCLFAAVTFFWNPISYVCEFRMVCPGRTMMVRLLKRVARNLPRSLLLSFGVVNAIGVMSDPVKINKIDGFWIEGGIIELFVNIIFIIYAVDKLALLRDWENTLLDSITKVSFEKR